MATLGALILSIIDKVLGLFSKQGDANSTAVIRQAGVDAEKTTSLEKSIEIAHSQTAAVIDAPTDEAGTIGDLRKGGF